MLICITGSFDLVLTDGSRERVIHFNRSNTGVLIPPGVWISMQNFCSGTVLLAVNSEYYDEADYIRDYAEFQRYVKDTYGD